MKRVWDHIDRTSQWWLQLEPYEPDQIQRLYRTSRERRWEVYFMTTRPSSAGETTQFQTQWWLEQHRFPLPSVLTVPGSRGDAANAVKLDIAVDDRLTNCVDIIAASRAKAVLLLRRDDPRHPRPGIGARHRRRQHARRSARRDRAIRGSQARPRLAACRGSRTGSNRPSTRTRRSRSMLAASSAA